MKNVRKIPNAQKKKKVKNTKDTFAKKQSNKLSKKLRDSEDSPLQWHPAFYAEIQIELKEELENLYFENEHQLGTKPKEIDILIIKKNNDIPVRKNIGRIFRKYNSIEYKSPEDSLTVNDFYKVLGYTYFYKADTIMDDEIKIDELTITFVSRHFPRKLFRHLEIEGTILTKIENGIWYTTYGTIPVQFIVTAQLSEQENFWLKNLTNDLQDKTTAKELIERYKEHKDDIHYDSVMDIIVKANKNIFNQGDENMCNALLELVQEQMQDKIDEMLNQVSIKSREDGMRLGEEKGLRLGEEKGLRLGEEKGLRLAKMVLRMNADGTDYETIASKCMLSVEEVMDILNF